MTALKYEVRKNRHKIIPEINYEDLNPKIKRVIGRIFFKYDEVEISELESVTNEFINLLYDELESKSCQRCDSKEIKAIMVNNTYWDYCERCGQIQGNFPIQQLEKSK